MTQPECRLLRHEAARSLGPFGEMTTREDPRTLRTMTKILVGVLGAGAGVLLLTMGGCTTTVNQTGTGPAPTGCAVRAGNYVVVSVEKSGGTCGALDDRTFVADDCHQLFCFGYDSQTLPGRPPLWKTADHRAAAQSLCQRTTALPSIHTSARARVEKVPAE